MKPSRTIIRLLLLTVCSARALAVDPAEVIASMTKRYAACRTYQDTGVVRIIDNGRTLSYPRPFKTFFIRPDYFRFEWTETTEQPEEGPYGTLAFRRVSGTNVIWSTPDGVHRFYHSVTSLDPGVKAVEDVISAVAGATGVSLGSANTIPSMLMSQIRSFRLTELQSLTLLREEKVDGNVCYHISGKSVSPPDDYELWIGKDDHLLRKIRTNGSSAESFVEEIHRDVRTDAGIPKTVFKFILPK